jgi:hypothetical protein
VLGKLSFALHNATHENHSEKIYQSTLIDSYQVKFNNNIDIRVCDDDNDDDAGERVQVDSIKLRRKRESRESSASGERKVEYRLLLIAFCAQNLAEENELKPESDDWNSLQLFKATKSTSESIK